MQSRTGVAMERISQDERELRAARNQATFRAVNEKVRQLIDAGLAAAASHTIACECADPTCVDTIEIGLEEYATVRANPRRFAVRPGHVLPDVERVVEEQ